MMRKKMKTLPDWLEKLLREFFFTPCSVHLSSIKNEKNVFCVDCCFSLCRFCVPSHSTHRLLQVRRYVYHDVLKLADAEKLFDCTAIQPYIVNNSKVVFLNSRESRSATTLHHTCTTCNRILKDQFRFCSISCKVDYILTEEGIGELARYLRRCDKLKLPDIAHGGHLTPDSVLEPPAATPAAAAAASSNSVPASSTNSSGNAVVSVLSTKTNDHPDPVVVFTTKKRTPTLRVRIDPPGTYGFGEGSSGSGGTGTGRRKGTPQRSPLC